MTRFEKKRARWLAEALARPIAPPKPPKLPKPVRLRDIATDIVESHEPVYFATSLGPCCVRRGGGGVFPWVYEAPGGSVLGHRKTKRAAVEAMLRWAANWPVVSP